jgi:sortase A
VTIRIAKAPLRTALRWTQAACFAGALALLGYCGYVLADSWNFQRTALLELEQTVKPVDQHAVAATLIRSAPPASVFKNAPLGRIDVPRLGISVAVFEGTSDLILRRAAGHIRGTALPGQPGNAAISAHRDTFFRPLRNIRRDDIINIITLNGQYRYRVLSTKIVRPTDLSVLDPGDGEALTLVTCYPFYFIGAAPSRFIVRAERIAPASPG